MAAQMDKTKLTSTVFRAAKQHVEAYRAFSAVYDRVVVPTQSFEGEAAEPLARLRKTGADLISAIEALGHTEFINTFDGLKTVNQLGLLAELLEALSGRAGATPRPRARVGDGGG